MMTFVLILHCIICLVLVVLVLVQRGRGGGLVESFSGVESMFGTRTSAFLTKATTVCAILFFVACVGLAVMSARRSRSLMANVVPTAAVVTEGTETAATAEDAVTGGAADVEKAVEQTPAE